MAEDYPDGAVAVVGMACKFPGADNVDEYWNLLHNGRSMCSEAPADRFAMRGSRRDQERTIYTGNYLSSIDSFDQKFFKKSSREAAAMDPQQRLLLEVAYQAVESSRYFGIAEHNEKVGCYVGVCTSDYNDNIASHPANAYSTLGSLRAFLSGRISHFFGWTGPSLTFDTACSSSAVAIDAACKALQIGSCSSAVAGGVSLFTSPYFFQNLSAASFLSPTGPSKFFDAEADGYSRGEGVGMVVLKKLSRAIADQDHIHCVLMSTAVAQSDSAVPITVPHAGSQTALYREILSSGGVTPEKITYIEAHGTGTRIGDVQEYEGIKEVFGSAERDGTLYLASVKGNIGHTEAASGIASLIKTALMMQKREIPRQANFKRLNPKMVLDPYSLTIPTSPLPWRAKTMLACINNFGASGSIAAMLVKQAPPRNVPADRPKSLAKYPVILSANTAKSLGEYASKLRGYIKQAGAGSDLTIADLTFGLSATQNRSLANVLATTVSSTSELDGLLRAVASGASTPEPRQHPKPVVLSFGGQTSRFVGLSERALEGSALLRAHLDECDRVIRSFGLDGVYPAIFETRPLGSVVTLHGAQFALQYSCARAWVDSGLRVDCVVGHSFGQLVALTVCGVLSLEDGLRLVHGRAALMERQWTGEGGAMLALEASAATARELIERTRADGGGGLEIACYNGATSQVLVGTEEAIDGLVAHLTRTGSARFKKLNVTHGFHSRLTEPILSGVYALAQSLTFNKPVIPIETCSDTQSWTEVNPQLIADHTRTPVFFAQAVERIANRLGACTWLEAGSQSSITAMASRALGSSSSKHTFFPVNLGRENALETLAETTAELWRGGHHAQFWPFHKSQSACYAPLNLPPYQFEKNRHWLDWVDTVDEKAPAKPSDAAQADGAEAKLLTFVGFSDGERHSAEFQINTRAEEWRRMVSGHAVLGNPLCPASMYLELVARAVQLHPDAHADDADPARRAPAPSLGFKALDIVAPLGISRDAAVRLRLARKPGVTGAYRFSFQSRAPGRPRGEQHPATTHATGTVGAACGVEVEAEFARTEGLLPYTRVAELLGRTDGEAMHGPLVYRVFGRVVRYEDFYKGVERVVAPGGGSAAAARVGAVGKGELAWAAEQVSSPLAVDGFIQVSGMLVNSLTAQGENEVSICTTVERIQRSAGFAASAAGGSWAVYVNSRRVSDRLVDNDIYVFDASTERLVMIILGARFNRVSMSSLARVLSRANDPVAAEDPPRRKSGGHSRKTSMVSVKAGLDAVVTTRPIAPAPARESAGPPPGQNAARLEDELRHLLSRITDVAESDFKCDVTLDDLGIDSLMTTEITAEVAVQFEVNISQADLPELTTFAALRDYVAHRSRRELGGCHDKRVDAATLELTHARLDLHESPASEPRPPPTNDSTEQRLAHLIAGLLDCPADFARSTGLADMGFDSLLWMELANDVERAFGARADVAQLATVSTFGELCDLVAGAASSSTM